MKQLKARRYLVYRMALRLFERQTGDEQERNSTTHRNNLGFNAADARKLSPIIKGAMAFNTEYENKFPGKHYGFSFKQCIVVSRRMVKYAQQLADIASEAEKPASAPPASISNKEHLQQEIARIENTPAPQENLFPKPR